MFYRLAWYSLAFLALLPSVGWSATSTYAGFVRATAGVTASHETNGSITVSLADSGAFTGSIKLGGTSLPIAGSLNGVGASETIRIPRTNKPALLLSFATGVSITGEKLLSGTLDVETPSSTEPFALVDADVADKKRTPATYTVAIRPTTTNELHPRGDGIGWLKVSATGIATFSGTLADGAPITFSSVVTKVKTVPMFASLYGGRGSFAARLEFDNKRSSDVKSIESWWFRPFINGSLLPHGWPEGISPEVVGAKYSILPGQSVLTGLDTVPDPNAHLKLSNGGLAASIDKALHVSKTNAITKARTSDTSYTVTLTPSTGALSGTFTHSNGKRTAFKGIVLQKGDNRKGFGHFLSTERAGEAELIYDILPQPTLVIAELMPKNTSSITDDDGAHSDWIELYNPGTTPVDLADWCLTDDKLLLSKWRFPATTLGAKEYLIVWASSKDRRVVGQPLHTNFNLGSDGEYLALVRPDGITIEQEFDPFPALLADESYGVNFIGAILTAPGASLRYLVPANDNLGTSWTGSSFADSTWKTGKSGLGFGVQVPGMTVRVIGAADAVGPVDNLATAAGLAALPEGHANIRQEDSRIRPMLNLLGEGGDGHYDSNEVVPLTIPDHYVVKATGWIGIQTAGNYVFGLNSDDGGRIRIDGNDVMVDDSNHGAEDHLSSPVTLAPGLHSFEVIMWEGGGGDEVEFFAAPGNASSWDESFKLVGGPGGLPVFTLPTGSSASPGGLVGTNIQSQMLNKNASCYIRVPFTASDVATLSGLTLHMRYNDGFIAYLNGTEIARRNAPAAPAFNSTATASRSVTESTVTEAIDVSSALPLLGNGKNILAIHGMNDSTADTAFLILPELLGTSVLRSATAVKFSPSGTALTATPGAPNDRPTFIGSVADTTFSVNRGFFSTPFSLAIATTTDGATIRYTLDGSTPSPTKGRVYTTPLRIARSTIVRAMAYKAGFEPTNVDTQTYLFPTDVIRQQPTGARPSSAWPPSGINGQELNYGMDPQVVNSTNPEIGGASRMKEALLAIPTLSLVTDLPNLFDPATGIYVNTHGRGAAWERPASLELIGDKNSTSGGFQINCGVRSRGGFSRSSDNPKHSFHFYFRTAYGDGALKYPLFGTEGASVFKRFDLRTSQNYSWSFGGDGNNTFMREELTRELQGSMGQPYGRSRYYHLYINGIYWGLYDTEERTEAAYGATYLGGAETDYDVVKAEQDSGYITGVTDGNLTAWTDLWNKAVTLSTDPTNERYFALQGLASDGVTPTADPVLLDADNLIDYMLLTFWTGNLDGATSAFLGEQHANNWFGMRNRLGVSGGFKFFAHDFEHTFFNIDEDRTGPFSSGDLVDSNPMWLHHLLRTNTEYRMRWADRVQKHLFNGGSFDTAKLIVRINNRKAIIDKAIIAESARWGDSKRLPSEPPLTRLDWLSAVSYLTNDYIPQRTSRVIQQLRTDDLYPDVDAPTLNLFGGNVATGTEIVINGTSTLYYTLDGTDPRQIGGTVNPTAQVYTSSTLTETLVTPTHSWKYLADGSNQGTAWRLAGFDDSTWQSGAAELGYGDGDEATLVPFVDTDPGTSGDQKNATTYFRTTFTASNVAELTSATLRLKYDDAAIVYLNGVEVVRTDNINSDATFTQFASSSTPDESADFDFTLSPSLLINGTNTLTAEIHQASAESSDISFRLSLTATRSNTPSPLFLNAPGPHRLQVRSLSSGDWSALVDCTYQVFSAPDLTINLAGNDVLNLGDTARTYTLTVNNTGSAPTNDTVTTTAVIPPGLDATNVAGSGWTVDALSPRLARVSRSDVLMDGDAYPPLTLTVDVKTTAPTSVTMNASVAGGGESNTTNSTATTTSPVFGTGTQEFVWASQAEPFSPDLINEKDGSISVTLLRRGRVTGTATVDVSTADGSAKSPGDFEAIPTQTLTFGEGETTKTITVNIVGDSLKEGNESFTLTLANPTNANVSNASNTVTIVDPDSIRPTISILQPAANGIVYLPLGGTMTVLTSASDNYGVRLVEGSLNGGPFITGERLGVALADSSNLLKWGIRFSPVPGVNTIAVRSVDYCNNTSPTLQRTFNVVTAVGLELLVTPSLAAGSIKTVPALPAPSLAEPGKTYTLSATAAPGYRFDHWTTPAGVVQAPSTTANVATDSTFTAVFVPNPFIPGILGTYSGLIRNLPAVERSNASNGMLTIKPTTSGAFTGTIRLDGDSLPIVGQLRNDGTSTTEVSRKNKSPLLLTLALDLNVGGTKTITGEVAVIGREANTPLASFTCYQGQSSAAVASYKVEVTSTQPGLSTGTIALSRTGTASLVLKLADGTTLTATSAIGPSMQAPLFASMYQGRGSFLALVQLALPLPADNVLSPESLWIRPFISGTSAPFGWPAGLDVTVKRVP